MLDEEGSEIFGPSERPEEVEPSNKPRVTLTKLTKAEPDAPIPFKSKQHPMLIKKPVNKRTAAGPLSAFERDEQRSKPGTRELAGIAGLSRRESMPLPEKDQAVIDMIVGMIPVVGTGIAAAGLTQGWGKMTPFQRAKAVGLIALSAGADVLIVGSSIRVLNQAARGGIVKQTLSAEKASEVVGLAKVGVKATPATKEIRSLDAAGITHVSTRRATIRGGKVKEVSVVATGGSKHQEQVAALGKALGGGDKTFSSIIKRVTVEAPATPIGMRHMGATVRALEAGGRRVNRLVIDVSTRLNKADAKKVVEHFSRSGADEGILYAPFPKRITIRSTQAAQTAGRPTRATKEATRLERDIEELLSNRPGSGGFIAAESARRGGRAALAASERLSKSTARVRTELGKRGVAAKTENIVVGAASKGGKTRIQRVLKLEPEAPVRGVRVKEPVAAGGGRGPANFFAGGASSTKGGRLTRVTGSGGPKTVFAVSPGTLIIAPGTTKGGATVPKVDGGGTGAPTRTPDVTPDTTPTVTPGKDPEIAEPARTPFTPQLPGTTGPIPGIAVPDIDVETEPRTPPIKEPKEPKRAPKKEPTETPTDEPTRKSTRTTPDEPGSSRITTPSTTGKLPGPGPGRTPDPTKTPRPLPDPEKLKTPAPIRTRTGQFTRAATTGQRYKLPGGKSLPPGVYPREVAWTQGFVQITLNLDTGARRTALTRKRGTPKTTFAVTRTDKTPPDEQRLRMGFERLHVTSKSLSFALDRQRAQGRNGNPFKRRRRM